MDKSGNLTRGTNASSPIPGQNCLWYNGTNGGNAVSLDKLLITTPSLSSVNQELKWIFPLHTYGFACLFFLLSFYTFFSILNLRSLISSRPFMSTINIFLCLLGVSRSGCLFIDPYNLQETMPKVIGSIMWDIGFPCVTSAFCLIQLAFLHLTELKFGPEKIQKESCLSLVITGHFSCIIASDFALAFHNHFIAKYVVQTVFLAWSILLYLTFLHAGYKIMNLLQTIPNNMVTRDNSVTSQKGVLQLAMLAPYNNLASSVAAALVPTMLSSPSGQIEITETDNRQSSHGSDPAKEGNSARRGQDDRRDGAGTRVDFGPISTVPEVYVRPPTPTPSTMNLPIIMVSSPSRRSSLASSNSRRGSDVSARSGSRRNSECSVRFINEEQEAEGSQVGGGDRSPSASEGPKRKRSPSIAAERPQTPEGILRRHSEMVVTPTGSSKDLRRCSDFSHEKNRSSQFAMKLRRNSDFGNRTPKRIVSNDFEQRLPKVLDASPTSSRRNSEHFTSFLSSVGKDSRRNSDVPCASSRRNSELSQMRPLNINRRSSDVSIRTLDKSPTHHHPVVIDTAEIHEKSESDSDQPDCNEKASLMTDKAPKDEPDTNKVRKKSLTWKNEKNRDENEEITAESSLLPDAQIRDNRVISNDFTLNAILNHIAHVNRSKSSEAPLYLPKVNSASTKKSQIRRLLNVTYATAILGIILCLADVLRIFGPYGLLGETIKYGSQPMMGQHPRPWPWLFYQTLCRGLEFLMGCVMANITKQASISPRHQYLNNYRSYTARQKALDAQGLYMKQ